MANLSAKGTVLIISGPRHDPERKHLFVICTDPDENGDQLLVGLCSIETNVPHDSTCVLQMHEHRFVRKPSYAFYARTRLISRQALEKGIAEGLMVPDADINGQAFLRVVNGVGRSAQTPRRMKTYLATRRAATITETQVAREPTRPDPTPE